MIFKKTKKQKNKKTKKHENTKIILRFLVVLLFLLFIPFSLRAAKNAIGIRVARNIEHLSPSEWYNRYAPAGDGKSGPASISFAGYEAVSIGSCASGNGETIYVNAANIAGSDLYTNIYIIACPIGADQDIVDIFKQLIDNWDFNVNITDKSEQGKIQRDTKRLSDVTILNDLLENYRENISPSKRYPELSSGTYEVGKSISSWTSWNDTLGNQLQANLPTPPVGQGWGPLTSLSDWTNSDKETVWPQDMFFPTGVGIDYTASGCRQITAVKDQKVASWCEGGCAECGALSYSDTAAWPAGTTAPADISINYQNPFSSSCRDLFAVQDGTYSVLDDNFSATAAVGCSGNFAPIPSEVLSNYISDWPDELKDPTAVSRGIDYNNCKHTFVVKGNKWSEYTVGADCASTGWTPISNLDTVPETLGIEWPKDIQDPDAISMAWDKDGQRHIYAFKGNDYREYIDYNRPYVYQTTNNGLSYSLCTNFETAYPSLSSANCSKIEGSNYSPTITTLRDQTVTIGNYFNYDIRAFDIDGDDLSWSIGLGLGCGAQTLGTSSISCGWNGSDLYAANTTQKNIKKIYGTAPNTVDNRTITITVSDGHGGTDTKSFKLNVTKSNLVITSVPVTNITIGDDYQYDVEAYDPQGYYPLTYSLTAPAGLTNTNINSTNGVIFGTPTSIGTYNVTAVVKNNNPDGVETVNQNFTIRVNDFSIVPIPDTEIPREDTINFFAKTNPEKVNKIEWSIACAPVTGNCANMNLNIDKFSGEITISAKDTVVLYDKFTMTVTATSTLNPAIAHTEDFNVMIGNPKCGNGTQEGAEQCDDGADGDDTNMCYDDCTFTYCGDGTVQTPNGAGLDGTATSRFDEECDKNSPTCCYNEQCMWSCSFNTKTGNQATSTTGSACISLGVNYLRSCSGMKANYDFIFPKDDSYSIKVQTTNDNGGGSPGLDTFDTDGANCPADGIQHHVKVSLDDVFIGDFCNDAWPDGDIKTGTVDLGTVSEGIHTITLQWDNDWTRPSSGAGSNIRIYDISIHSNLYPSNITHFGPLDFYDNVTEKTADNITLQSGMNNGEIVFPACRIFDATSGKIDAELVLYDTAIVYVTDTSDSMPDDFQFAIGNTLQSQMDSLHTVATNSTMLGEGKSILVGLVEFGNTIDSHSIVNIASGANLASLKTEINVYDDDGSATHTKEGITEAYNMLSDVTADKKIIILLSDGTPTPATEDPAEIINTAKLSGINIYSIAYNADCTNNSGFCQNMCSWSSDNGVNCWIDKYSYKTSNAATSYSAITNKISGVPSGAVSLSVSVNEAISNFVAPVYPTTSVSNIFLNLSGVTCGDIGQNIPITASYIGGGGQIKFSNARVDICDSCNSIAYGDGIIEPGEECDCGVGGICSLAELNYKTCTIQGYDGGQLGCYPPGSPKQGKFDYSLCTYGACVFDSSSFDSCSFTSDPNCGDDFISFGEDCDCGYGWFCTPSKLNGETCSSQGFTGGSLWCNEKGTTDECKFDTSACTNSVCGDGVIDVGEWCDCGADWVCTSAELNNQTCISQGYTGPAVGGLDCIAPGNPGECGFDQSACTPLCGNNTIEAAEQCDGTDLGGNDCATIPGGFTGGNLDCSADCASYDTSSCT